MSTEPPRSGGDEHQPRSGGDEHRTGFGSAELGRPAELAPGVHFLFTGRGGGEAAMREALPLWREALRQKPDYWVAYNNIMFGLAGIGDEEADRLAQVERDATRIAKDRGLSIVFVNIWAAAGGYDMTNQVISDIESQHE